ncbi:MAG: zinc ribbon domain-containing protein [Spirochaetaceae bacterium]|nr:MAG: zinc ribbon domain-containing protein [Spirochaetaceae bacterium]
MTYDYKCAACSGAFEITATIAEKEAGLSPACPACGSTETRQVFTVFGIVSGTASQSACGCASDGECAGPEFGRCCRAS